MHELIQKDSAHSKKKPTKKDTVQSKPTYKMCLQTMDKIELPLIPSFSLGPYEYKGGDNIKDFTKKIIEEALKLYPSLKT